MISPIYQFSEEEKNKALIAKRNKFKLHIMFTPDREINPLSFYEKDEEPEIEIEKCDNCKVEEPTYLLGITTYGLKPDSMVCQFCLNELHQNITLTN